MSSTGELEPHDDHIEAADVEAAEIVDLEPEQLATLVRQVGTYLRRTEFHMGPLPAAKSLAEYEHALPGLADRIVSMAEREQANRHGLQRAEVEQPYRLAQRGQNLAILTVVLVLGLAVFLAYQGAVVAGTVIASIDLLGLVVVFVTGQAGPAKSDGPAGADEDSD